MELYVADACNIAKLRRLCIEGVCSDMQAFDIASQENPSFVGEALHSSYQASYLRESPTCMHSGASHACLAWAVLSSTAEINC